MAYKSFIKVNKGNINNVKELVAKYDKMFNRYSAELQRLYIEPNEDGNIFSVVAPEISIINCDYAYEKYGNRSTIGIGYKGQLEMNIGFPNWATTEEELEDIQRGIQRVYSAKMMYLDFLNEFMMFDEEKYPSTSDTVSDSRRIKDDAVNVEDAVYDAIMQASPAVQDAIVEIARDNYDLSEFESTEDLSNTIWNDIDYLVSQLPEDLQEDFADTYGF